MVNTCRATNCRDRIPDDQIMCRWHWSCVTVATRVRLCKARKTDPQSQTCHEAIHDAVNEVDEYLRAREAGFRPERMKHAV